MNNFGAAHVWTLTNVGQEFWCCQTNSNTSQSTTITQIYEAQIWNHSVRAALRFCL